MAVTKVILTKRNNSKYFQMRWIDSETGRERWQSTKTNIKRDAERIAGQTEKDLNEGTYYRIVKTDWAEFRDRYETEVVTGLAKRTSEKVGTIFNHVERIINPKRLANINSNAISKIIKQLRSEGLKEVTIKNSLGHLKAALNWAESVNLITKAPRFPKFKRARTEKAMKGRPITLEEFERMLDKVPDVVKLATDTKEQNARKAAVVESWKFYLRGLWASGLRLEESLELHWEREDKLSVDFSGKYPMLRIRAESEKGNKDRLLPIVPEFEELLNEIPPEERTGYVFNPLPERNHGKRLTKWTASDKIALIGKKANVVVDDSIDSSTGERKVKYASAHDLRRSFGEWWSSKVMPATLMQLMRHESMETTMKFYVGRNAEKVAADIRSSGAGLRSTSRSTPENGDVPEDCDNSQSVTTKEVRK